jgi:hypothetical protein
MSKGLHTRHYSRKSLTKTVHIFYKNTRKNINAKYLRSGKKISTSTFHICLFPPKSNVLMQVPKKFAGPL